MYTLGVPWWLSGKEYACEAEATGDTGSGRSPGEGHGNPLQYSCLENPMDRPWDHEELHTTEATWHTCMYTLHCFPQ